MGKFLSTFKEFPPSQKPSSFSIDQVMEKLGRTPVQAGRKKNLMWNSHVATPLPRMWPMRLGKAFVSIRLLTFNGDGECSLLGFCIGTGYGSQFVATFKEYPPRLRVEGSSGAGTFQVIEKLKQNLGGH